MRLHFTSFFCSVAFSVIATVASAEEVSLRHNALMLLADFVNVDDPQGPVALITHGTLAHKDMELIDALQASLAEEGIPSLAHTLSLNGDLRRGMFDCNRIHTHRDEDADAEIAAWIKWLKDVGHDQIALVGHSRGGKQVARTAVSREDLAAVVLIAPATAAGAERAYQRALTRDELALQQTDGTPEIPVKTPAFLHCGPSQVTHDSHASYYSDRPRGAESYVTEITSPVLVIAGSKDAVVPSVPAIYMPMQNEMLRFELIEDADHMFLDFFAEDAAMMIAEFLTQLAVEVDDLDLEAANKELYENADLSYGEYLGSECVSCHHANASEGVPPISGYEPWYTHLALIQYANGERENAAMRLVARSLDDEQRIAVAAYFATLKTE